MKWISAIVLGTSILACAIEPPIPPSSELEAARSVYRRAAEDPGVREKAAAQLSEAEQALQRAEAAWVRGESSGEIALLSYLAERRVLFARWAASRGPAEGESGTAFSRDAEAERDPDRARGLADLQAMALDAELTARGLVVTLGRPLFDRSELKPLAQAMLDRVAEFLDKHPQRRVSVEGYTDDMGSPSYDERVSTERAEAVTRYLQLRGVAASRLSAAGFGASQPRVPNTSKAGRRLNRRVEILIENPGP